MGYPKGTLCEVCGKPGRRGDPLTKGHIIPKAYGGPNASWNIRPEHASCNRNRGSDYTRADVAEAMRRHQVEKSQKRVAEAQRTGRLEEAGATGLQLEGG